MAPFFDWLTENGLPVSAAQADADLDGDGVPNLLEFVLGTAPDASGAAPVIATTVSTGGDGDEEEFYPAIRYTRRQDRGGGVVAVEIAESLDFAALVPAQETTVVPLGDGLEEVTARSTIPLDAAPRQFLRIRATLP